MAFRNMQYDLKLCFTQAVGAVLALGITDAGIGPVIAEQLDLFGGGAVEQHAAVFQGGFGIGVEAEMPGGMFEEDHVIGAGVTRDEEIAVAGKLEGNVARRMA